MSYHWDPNCPGMAGDHVLCTCGNQKENKVILVQEPPTYRPVDLSSAVVCERCGVLVGDQDDHTEWHVSLTTAIHHLADGVVGLFAAQPGGADLLAEIEDEQRQSEGK